MAALEIGLTWPTPGPDNAPPEPEHFAQIRAGGFDRLRINLDHRRDRHNVTDWITAIRAAGLEPLVILDGDYDAPDVLALADMAAHAWYVQQAQGRPIWWTEVGWDLSGNSLEEQAAYTIGELDAAVRLGVALVCFYAMVGDSSTGQSDWGFWNGQWEERPVVDAVRTWQAQQGAR